MKIGMSLPQIGTQASAESLIKVAQRAESLGYDSVWVLERLLWPLNPQGEIFCILQIEDTRGVENLDAMLTKLPGIGAILIGGGVIYVYPYWSPGAAIAWVAGGIALQVWLCARPSSRRGSGLFTQVGAGLLYAFSMVVFSGGCYQS